MYIIFLSGVPLCNCDAPPFGFWYIQFYLSKKKKKSHLILEDMNRSRRACPNKQGCHSLSVGSGMCVALNIEDSPRK
jgi:hypothetical protein